MVKRYETDFICRNGSWIDLTATEYKLLCFFLENPNLTLSPDQILSRLWDREENYIDNSTPVYIRRLCAKIEDDASNPKKLSPFAAWDTSGIRQIEVSYENPGQPKHPVTFYLHWFIDPWLHIAICV